MYCFTLVMAEAFNPRNKIHLANFRLRGGNDCTHGCFIEDDGIPTKIAPSNYISDSTGAQVYTTQISVVGLNLRSVKTRCLAADVSQFDNFTWPSAGRCLVMEGLKANWTPPQYNTPLVVCFMRTPAGVCAGIMAQRRLQQGHPARHPTVEHDPSSIWRRWRQAMGT